MKLLSRSFFRACADFFSPKMISMMIILPVLSLLFWGALILWNWSSWTLGLGNFFGGTWLFRQLSTWMPNTNPGSMGEFTAALFLIFILFPLVYLTTLFLVSFLVVPIVQRHLLGGDFQTLERKKGGSFFGSISNALRSVGLYLVVYVLTLPLWLVPGIQLLVPIVLTAWLSMRVLTYDLLQDVATDEERDLLQKRHRTSLFLLGCLFGVLVLLPGAAFFQPVLATLAFGHFCYGSLDLLRKNATNSSEKVSN